MRMLLGACHWSFGVLLCLSEKLFHLSALRMVRIRLKKLLPGGNRRLPVALRLPLHKADVEQCVGIVGIETQCVIPSADCLIIVPAKMIGTAELYEDDGVRFNSDGFLIILCRNGELAHLIIDLTDFRQQEGIVRRLPQSGQ